MVYNERAWLEVTMTTSDMVRELCVKQNISIAELCRRIEQTP